MSNKSFIIKMFRSFAPRWFRVSLLLFGLIISSTASEAQELMCKVKVMHDKITNVDQQVFTSMERAISDFVNTRKWTNDEFAVTERVECNMLINLTSKNDKDPDLWSATISVQATRPVYNSNYNSPLLNTVDRDLVFRHSQFNPITFDDNRVSGSDPLEANLPAVLAYYSYLILALDYDSFSPNGGTALLKKAQNIVSNAPEDGAIHGWKAFEEKRNRYWIIDQLLSPRYATFRTAWYSIHREGLDIMWTKPAEGRLKVLAALTTIQNILRDNQQSTLIQGFFNAKSDEITRIVMQGDRDERTKYLTLLAQIDPTNAGKYSALK
jgi:hypothetical protein